MGVCGGEFSEKNYSRAEVFKRKKWSNSPAGRECPLGLCDCTVMEASFETTFKNQVMITEGTGNRVNE